MFHVEHSTFSPCKISPHNGTPSLPRGTLDRVNSEREVCSTWNIQTSIRKELRLDAERAQTDGWNKVGFPLISPPRQDYGRTPAYRSRHC